MKDKNLLILTSDYPDKDNKMIGSLFVKEQVEYLKNYFNNVYVIAPVLTAFGLTKQSKFCKNYNYDNVSVYFPRCLFYPRAINIFPVSNYTKLSYDNRYTVIKNTIKKYNLKFDLIHAHMTFPATYAACKLKEEYSVPVVATLHEDTGWFLEEIEMYHPKLNFAWKNSDMLIRVNKAELQLLQGYNKNVRFVPNGFTNTYKPLDKYECRKNLGIPDNEKMVFSYGYLDERKGFQILLLGILYAKTIDKNIKCYISGSGPYKYILEKLIIHHELENHVKLLDFMTDEELVQWINSADVFVFPSIKESFGITQLNALACGVPVVASKNVGSKEIICDKCGLLYEIDDFSELGNKIFECINNIVWDRDSIRNYVVKNYSWEGISKQLIDLYKELI